MYYMKVSSTSQVQWKEQKASRALREAADIIKGSSASLQVQQYSHPEWPYGTVSLREAVWYRPSRRLVVHEGQLSLTGTAAQSLRMAIWYSHSQGSLLVQALKETV